MSPFRLYNDELTLVGSMAVLHSYARAVEMFAAGALQAATMVSHAFSLDDYGEAVELFRAGKGRKLQIRPQATRSVELLSTSDDASERGSMPTAESTLPTSPPG